MTLIKKNFLLNCIYFFSIFALFLAYFTQYILNHQPCNLCLIERIPYFVAIILLSLRFVINKYEKLILLIVTLFFIIGAIVSFYHFGIEQGFFSESPVCNLKSISNNTSAAELLKEMKEKIVSCKDVTFRILGFSLATINTIISLLLSAIMYKILKNYEKN